jgi:hypothetical protein
VEAKKSTLEIADGSAAKEAKRWSSLEEEDVSGPEVKR